MPPIEFERFVIFGRPFKPIALGYMLLMFVTTTEAFTGTGGNLGQDTPAKIVGVFAAITGITLLAGWLFRSQKIAEAGMFGSIAVWVFRTGVLFWTDRAWDVVALAAIVTFMIWGSTMYEVRKTDNPFSATAHSA